MSSRNALILGGLGYLAIGAMIAIVISWRNEYGLLLNELFTMGVCSLAITFAVLAYLYRVRGGSTRLAQCVLGVLVIVAAASMEVNFSILAKHVEKWKPHFLSEYPSLIVFAELFVAYAKSITAFGIAALGANIAASSITRKETLCAQPINPPSAVR